jgi:hypothetical protein
MKYHGIKLGIKILWCLVKKGVGAAAAAGAGVGAGPLVI